MDGPKFLVLCFLNLLSIYSILTTKQSMNLAIVVAKASNNVIGNNNQLIWHLPADLKHFKEITSGHPIIMGRKTYESIGRPLPNRRNIIISRNKKLRIEGCEVVNSLEDALKLVSEEKSVFIIGGANIYQQSMFLANTLYVTEVHQNFEGDAFFPEIDKNIWKETERHNHKPDEKNTIPYSFITYKKFKKIIS